MDHGLHENKTKSADSAILTIHRYTFEKKQSRVTEQTVMNRVPKHNQPHNNISMFTLILARSQRRTQTHTHNL